MPGHRANWDLQAITAWRLERLQHSEPSWPEGGSPAMEDYRQERARMAKLERLERENVLVRRVVIHTHLTRFASIIRKLGEQLQKAYGEDAGEMLSEAIDDAERELKHITNDRDSNTADPPF